MAYKILKVPHEQDAMAELGLKIVMAAESMGSRLDHKGFLQAWLTNTKVLAEVDDDDNIKALAFVVTGRKWFDSYDTATLLLLLGDSPDQMMSYVKNVASASGAHSLIYDTGGRFELDPNTEVMYIHEVKL